MATIPKTLNVPKEMSEVADALAGIIIDIKAKKPLVEILAGNLQKLMVAVEGFDQLDDEQKSPEFANAIGYLVSQLGPLFNKA